MASRTRVAAYVADRLTHDRHDALKAAASWLVETGKTRQAEYLARDVAQILAGRGYVYVRVTTARHMTETARHKIEHFVREATGAKHLEVETVIDKSLIGGARIEVPGAELDSTVRSKLAKFVEGVSR